MTFSTKWCCWALNAACLASVQHLTSQVVLFNANQKKLFASWRRWRGEMRNEGKENKCYIANESHRGWYFEIWAEEGHMRRRERKLYPGRRSYQHKKSGLARRIWERVKTFGKKRECRRQVAREMMVRVAEGAKARRVGGAWGWGRTGRTHP